MANFTLPDLGSIHVHVHDQPTFIYTIFNTINKCVFQLNTNAVIIYTQTNFQRPHFQFDTVWLIEHVQL